ERLQRDQCDCSRARVHKCGYDEYRMPADSGGQHIGERHEEGGGALCGVEQPGVGGRVFGAVDIGAGRREQAVHLAPGARHNTTPVRIPNSTGSRPRRLSAQMPAASSAKAMNIVFSRPIWSDTQPKNGRVSPFKTRSIDSAKVSAGTVNPRRDTGTLAISKSV